MKFCIPVVLLLAALSGPGATAEATAPDDRQQILQLNQTIPTLLKEQGFAAYATHFHLEFTNWLMDYDLLRSRERFLSDVNKWFAAGNYAIASETKPVSLLIEGDRALLREIKRETFSDGKGVQTQFAYRGTVTLRKEQGRWLFHSISLMEISNDVFDKRLTN